MTVVAAGPPEGWTHSDLEFANVLLHLSSLAALGIENEFLSSPIYSYEKQWQ